MTAGQFGVTEIGAEQTSTGYEVAIRNTSTGLYSVWYTDSNGNVTYAPVAGVAAASPLLEAIESSFHQDLNGDGVIGINGTAIESSGATSLVQSGNDYYMLNNTTGIGPELMYGGAPLTVGEFAWTPIAAEQTSTGYEVAIQNGSSYGVWYTDANGNVSYGANPLVQTIEASFQQDLNGDGIIGLPANTTVIEQLGSTSLLQAGNNYYLDNNSTGLGPELKYAGAAVTANEFSNTIAPVGVEQTSTGYEVAWRDSSNNKFIFWETDSNGTYLSNRSMWVSPASPLAGIAGEHAPSGSEQRRHHRTSRQHHADRVPGHHQPRPGRQPLLSREQQHGVRSGADVRQRARDGRPVRLDAVRRRADLERL